MNTEQPARYLVTGAAGFIGSRVSELLLESGHLVTGIDNLNDAYDVRIKQHRLARLRSHSSFDFHHVDISQRVELEPVKSQRYAAVINLAARAGVRQSVENPWVYVDTNVTGTLNLLEICRTSGIPKFILASTSSIYGANAPLPTPETADSDHPLQPYAASKKGAEALAHSYHFLHGLDVSVVRYFTVYGPAGRPDMVMFRFIQWISEERPVLLNGSGEQSRGFTYVDDIARGTILALKPLGFEIINLGGHETITINALIQYLEKKIGRTAEVVHLEQNPADMQTNWADVRKAKSLLGWEPQVDLATGIGNTVAWYQAEHAWASQLNTT
jgi:nucleoside-diphosphate-sugar epimerase